MSTRCDSETSESDSQIHTFLLDTRKYELIRCLGVIFIRFSSLKAKIGICIRHNIG